MKEEKRNVQQENLITMQYLIILSEISCKKIKE